MYPELTAEMQRQVAEALIDLASAKTMVTPQISQRCH